MTVIAEIDQIISLLEARLPANVNSPQNRRLVARLQRDLAKYFRDLGNAFPYGKLDKLYIRYVKESLGSETDDIIEALIKAFGSGFVTMIEGHLTTIYIDGAVQMMTWGKTAMGIPIPFEGPPIEEAISYAKTHGAKLVTQVDATTKERIAKIISDGIKNKRGIPGIQADIRRQFKDWGRIREMPVSRANLIARTETRQALFKSLHDKSVEMGVDGKEWILGAGGIGGNCDNCIANADERVIPVNQSFSTPEEAIHPGCTCSIAPAILRK